MGQFPIIAGDGLFRHPAGSPRGVFAFRQWAKRMAITQKAELINMLAEVIMDETRNASVTYHNGVRPGPQDGARRTIEPTGERCIVITWCDQT